MKAMRITALVAVALALAGIAATSATARKAPFYLRTAAGRMDPDHPAVNWALQSMTVSGTSGTVHCTPAEEPPWEDIIVYEQPNSGKLPIEIEHFNTQSCRLAGSGGEVGVAVEFGGGPWSGELTSKGQVKLKGNKKILLDITGEGVDCEYEASTLKGSFTPGSEGKPASIEPIFSNQAFKANKKSAKKCGKKASMTISTVLKTVESETVKGGETLESE
jgi:hypothetical protein